MFVRGLRELVLQNVGIYEGMIAFMRCHGPALYMLDMSSNEVILESKMEELLRTCKSLRVFIVNERCCDCLQFRHETLMVFGLRVEYYAEVEDSSVGEKILRIVREVTRKERFPKLMCFRMIGLDCYLLCRRQWEVVYEAYKCCAAVDVSLYDGNDVLLREETMDTVRPIQ